MIKTVCITSINIYIFQCSLHLNAVYLMEILSAIASFGCFNSCSETVILIDLLAWAMTIANSFFFSNQFFSFLSYRGEKFLTGNIFDLVAACLTCHGMQLAHVYINHRLLTSMKLPEYTSVFNPSFQPNCENCTIQMQWKIIFDSSDTCMEEFSEIFEL